MESVINTPEWSKITESTRYRLAEDSGNVNIYYSIFKALFKDKILK